MTDQEQIWNDINQAIKEDRKEHPNFPDHPCGKSAWVAAPVGRLIDLTVCEKYKQGIDLELNKKEQAAAAVKIIARAYRFLENLNK